MSLKTPSKNRTFIYGYHGQSNFGDDVFLKEIYSELDYYDVIYLKSGHNPLPLSSSRLKKIHSPIIFKRLIWLKIFFYLLFCNSIHFCAGSLFKSQSFFLCFITLYLIKKINPRFKIICKGVSIGPLENNNNKYWMQKINNLFDLCIVRDKYSENFNEINVFKEDIALNYFRKFKCEKNVISYDLAVCVNKEFCESDVYNDLVEIICRNFQNKNICLIQACNDNNDGDFIYTNFLYQKLKDTCSVDILNYSPVHLDDFIMSFNSFKFIITSRMHVGLLGHILSIKTFQFMYADKIEKLYESHKINNVILFSDIKQITKNDNFI